MTKIRRVRISIQTERLVAMNHSRSLYGPCISCAGQTRLITIDLAALLTHASSREIYREVEAGLLHFIESEGSVLICFNSLVNDLNLKPPVSRP